MNATTTTSKELDMQTTNQPPHPEVPHFWRDGEWHQRCACLAQPSPHAPRDRHPGDRP